MDRRINVRMARPNWSKGEFLVGVSLQSLVVLFAQVEACRQLTVVDMCVQCVSVESTTATGHVYPPHKASHNPPWLNCRLICTSRLQTADYRLLLPATVTVTL